MTPRRRATQRLPRHRTNSEYDVLPVAQLDQMRQRMVSIGDDFWIENEQGAKVFRVNGEALRLRQTLIFEDAHGNELY